MVVESEDTFRTLFQHMRDGLAYCRMHFVDGEPRDFIYIAVNDAFEELTGLKGVTGRWVSEVIPGIRESDPTLFERYGRVASTGQSDRFELHVKALEMWFDISVYSPAPDHFVAVFDVVTERKLAELRAESIRRIFELRGDLGDVRQCIRDILLLIQEFSGCEAVGLRLRDGDDFPYYETSGFVEGHVEHENSLCQWDADNQVVRDPLGNPVLECMCGNILCGRTNPDLPFFTPGGSFWSSCTSELLASTSDAERLTRTRNRCNGEGYESVALIPLRAGEGIVGLLQLNDRRRGRFTRANIEFYEPIAQTIGAVVSRVRAERAVQSSAYLLKTIIEGLPDAVYVKDLLGKYRLVNSAAGRIVGRRPEEVIGRDDTFLFPSAEAKWVMTKDQGVMASGVTSTYEEEVTSAGGERRAFLSTKGPIFDAAGKVTGLFGIARDITDQKMAEAHKRSLEHQLFQSQKMDAVGQLAAGVAHDFNNILAAIMMELTSIDVASASREEMGEAVGDVLGAAERAAALTRKLLLFGRCQTMVVGTHDLHGLVRELSRLLNRLLGEQVNLVVEGTGAERWIKGDAGMVEQVVVNLCVNARDAMPRGGRLVLSTESVPAKDGDPPEHCLSVSDTGQGMPQEMLDRIFEPFFSTKERGKGTGLGLSIVHGIVAQHRGRITVESCLGRGTTFRVFFPAAAPPPPCQAEAPQAPAARGRETILVVEDEATLLRLAGMSLRRAGYRVIEAQDGPSALRAWEEAQGAIELLLTDIVMPGGWSGLELCAELRRRKPALRTVVMSGYSSEIEERPPQVAYLQKPYTLNTLVGLVRACLDAPDDCIGGLANASFRPSVQF